MANGPVQIILNADNYRQLKENPPGGGSKDFFADKDAEFAKHKTSLISALHKTAQALSPEVGTTSIGYTAVKLRQQAWAKSHRPIRSLFRDERTPLVGGGDIGELIFEVTPDALEVIADDIASTEPQTRWKRDRFGNMRATPSRKRSETGAIETVRLLSAADRRNFSADTAVTWLGDRRSGGLYRIELFEMPPARSLWTSLPKRKRELFESFHEGLLKLGSGLVSFRPNAPSDLNPALYLRLCSGLDSSHISYERRSRDDPPIQAELELDPNRHQQLLEFLESNQLVRSITLPPVVTQSHKSAGSIGYEASIPVRADDTNYPIVGVIDGGICGALGDWVVRSWDLLSEDHKEIEHGSFIAGLLVSAQQFNGSDIYSEADGCDLIDVCVFPKPTAENHFSTYFPHGINDFLDEIEAAIQELRETHRVRVFNLSINAIELAKENSYSEFAVRLDTMAIEHDVIFVISAGNLEPDKARPEFPADPLIALKIAAASTEDKLLVPAESIRNISVASVNPPGLSSAVAHLPSRYSRRGPTSRSTVKPDLCHVGGSGTPDPTFNTGLASTNGDGELCFNCGTSFAAPLVAKTLATLDNSIEGSTERETLLCLLAHFSEVPNALDKKEWLGVREQFVGYGLPQRVADMLGGNAHSATLVFNSTLKYGQQLVFPFSWPPSLVDASGKCRGRIKLTMVSTPPLDYRYGAESVRVNLEPKLQQEQLDGKFKGRLSPANASSGAEKSFESDLIAAGKKWCPVKQFRRVIPRGVGASSTWRLVVDFLSRNGEDLPDGVRFALMLTIEDADRANPVFDELRQNLQSVGAQISDIQTAARMRVVS